MGHYLIGQHSCSCGRTIKLETITLEIRCFAGICISGSEIKLETYQRMCPGAVNWCINKVGNLSFGKSAKCPERPDKNLDYEQKHSIQKLVYQLNNCQSVVAVALRRFTGILNVKQVCWSSEVTVSDPLWASAIWPAINRPSPSECP